MFVNLWITTLFEIVITAGIFFWHNFLTWHLGPTCYNARRVSECWWCVFVPVWWKAHLIIWVFNAFIYPLNFLLHLFQFIFWRLWVIQFVKDRNWTVILVWFHIFSDYANYWELFKEWGCSLLNKHLSLHVPTCTFEPKTVNISEILFLYTVFKGGVVKFHYMERVFKSTCICILSTCLFLD